MAVINFQAKRFEYYDSLYGSNEKCLTFLRNYVHDEAKQQAIDFDFDGWENYSPRNIPRQTNGCDCGVFALKFADYLAENCQLDFSQQDMPYFRKRMVKEIVQKLVI